jgi:hypothetical protein
MLSTMPSIGRSSGSRNKPPTLAHSQPRFDVQLINFSIVPLHLQVPFAAGISAVWTVILSMMRGSCEEEEDPASSDDNSVRFFGLAAHLTSCSILYLSSL